ncbi:MAG: hydrolase 2, exosortase A system-associated [Piscinibacter sp.]|uniref:hydrolase 2, exosortase A system-associated n=1 Tax=Piscinibacter sp. TaxID=1903157 RepID=UPI003D1028E3
MTTGRPVAQSARFVPGSGGHRFVMISEPADGQAIGTVLWAHAFAEEMNKSRRMCARLARDLAQAGWRVLQPDLAGCGDSAGDFRAARWEDWVSDLRDEVRGAAADRPLWLWGVRAGALLLPPLLETRPDAHLLLWQPAVSGAVVLQQFLRLHAGARIVGAEKATPADRTPAQRLADGETVELGGYELAPELAASLKQAEFKPPPGSVGRIAWLEVAHADNAEPTAAAQRLVSGWQVAGRDVSLDLVRGPQFWQTQEIEDCDALISLSLERVGVA